MKLQKFVPGALRYRVWLPVKARQSRAGSWQTRAMALDHGEQNIRVNCICPGDVRTALLRDEAQQLGEPIDRVLAESAAGRPLQRIGQPEDIARAALYLASDASSYMTGAYLLVDGGGLAGG